MHPQKQHFYVRVRMKELMSWRWIGQSFVNVAKKEVYTGSHKYVSIYSAYRVEYEVIMVT